MICTHGRLHRHVFLDTCLGKSLSKFQYFPHISRRRLEHLRHFALCQRFRLYPLQMFQYLYRWISYSPSHKTGSGSHRCLNRSDGRRVRLRNDETDGVFLLTAIDGCRLPYVRRGLRSASTSTPMPYLKSMTQSISHPTMMQSAVPKASGTYRVRSRRCSTSVIGEGIFPIFIKVNCNSKSDSFPKFFKQQKQCG